MEGCSTSHPRAVGRCSSTSRRASCVSRAGTSSRTSRREFSKFEALGVHKVLTITTDPLDALEQKAADEGLTSEVLADPGIGASKEWGTAGIGMMGPQINGHSFILVNEDGVIEWRADYGGPPDHTMYLPVSNVLADMRAAVGNGASS
jgi:peroxiredoxin